MEIYYLFVFFIFGTCFGSFYNVVGNRLSLGESIIKPRSHCDNCGHVLGPLELIPIVSYIIQGGKCVKCHKHLSIEYPLYELLCGLMFAITYYIYGFNLSIIIPLTFLSLILIVLVSDLKYMIIPDEVLVTFIILLFIEQACLSGLTSALFGILYGTISMTIMYLIKRLGDFIFKKESMGGGDIKLMFIFGQMFGVPLSLITIIIAAFVGIPTIIITLLGKNNHEVPFGPLLGVGALIVMYTGLNMDLIYQLLSIH